MDRKRDRKTERHHIVFKALTSQQPRFKFIFVFEEVPYLGNGRVTMTSTELFS